MRHHNAFAFFTTNHTPMVRTVHAKTSAKNDLVRTDGTGAPVVKEETFTEGKMWLDVKAFRL